MVTKGIWGKLGIGRHGNMVQSRKDRGKLKAHQIKCLVTWYLMESMSTSKIIPHTCTCVGADCCVYSEVFAMCMYMYVKVVSKSVYRNHKHNHCNVAIKLKKSNNTVNHRSISG